MMLMLSPTIGVLVTLFVLVITTTKFNKGCDAFTISTTTTTKATTLVFNTRHISSITPTQLLQSLDDDFTQETPDVIKERINDLITEHPVVLFMKGSKLFPQCGFSNTAIQVLNSYNIPFHTVDVLSDQNIRTGIKEFSQWPTIPQLYVCGEFIGGSDIMIEMYQSGELGEMIEKAKAEMI
jgi:monothiol glutaredoxin